MIFCEARPYQNADSPDVHPVFRGKQHVHLMASTEAELLSYAQAIGVPIRWIQRDRGKPPHFDLTGRFMAIVLSDPLVTKLDRPQWVAAWRDLREQLNQANRPEQ